MATNSELERRIKKLEDGSQLTFPLDIVSQTIINEKKLRFEAEETGVDTETLTLRITIDGKIYKINARL